MNEMFPFCKIFVEYVIVKCNHFIMSVIVVYATMKMGCDCEEIFPYDALPVFSSLSLPGEEVHERV